MLKIACDGIKPRAKVNPPRLSKLQKKVDHVDTRQRAIPNIVCFHQVKLQKDNKAGTFMVDHLFRRNRGKEEANGP